MYVYLFIIILYIILVIYLSDKSRSLYILPSDVNICGIKYFVNINKPHHTPLRDLVRQYPRVLIFIENQHRGIVEGIIYNNTYIDTYTSLSMYINNTNDYDAIFLNNINIELYQLILDCIKEKRAYSILTVKIGNMKKYW